VKIRLNPVIHEAAGALRWLGVRDRLRCPECKAVGTWKPHGTLWDRWRDNDRPARRWLCKCCGLYFGPEGKRYCWPSAEKRVWMLPDGDRQPTPLDLLREGNVWPWRG
jgi:hypothetical protein